MTKQIKTDSDISTIYLKKNFEEIDTKIMQQPVIPSSYEVVLNRTKTARPTKSAHTFTVTEALGRATFLRGMGDNVNRVAEVSRKETIYSNEVAIDLYLSDDELAEAALAGEPLEASRALGCVRLIKERLEVLIAKGDPEANPYGLVNQPAVTPIVNALGDLTGGAITGQQAYSVFYNAYEDMDNSSHGHSKPNKLLIPPALYTHLGQLQMNPGQETLTVIQHLNNVFPELQIIKWYHAENAGLGGAINRAVMFKDHEDVVTHLVARDITRGDFSLNHGEYSTRYSMKTFGVYLKDLTGIRYIDDV